MGKIFDALEKSSKEKQGEEISDSSDLPVTVSDEQERAYSTIISSANERELDPKLVVLFQPQTFEAEQFRTLKTNLLFSSEEDTPKTIMVTSAMPDEGKSFVAANLAVTFAQSVDEHVLLMDCDLRLPTVHKLFGLKDNTPGLSDFLTGEIDVPSALYKTKIDKLSIVPGGKKTHNPTELLSSARMTSLIKEVKTRYNDRYIIIDSPPPLLTAETYAISKQVDGIIVVVRHDSTSRNAVKEMIDMLDTDKVLGVIINRYDVRLAKYYGYGKYGTYYGNK